MSESTSPFGRPPQFTCPACPAGIMALAVEMIDTVIYVCGSDRCGAALWVPTEAGHLSEQVLRARFASFRLSANRPPDVT